MAIWTGYNEDGSRVDMPEAKRQDYIRLFKEQAGVPAPTFKAQQQAARGAVQGGDCGCAGRKKGKDGKRN